MDAQQITITNYNFLPNTLTVPVGTKVTWINHDEVPHTIVNSDKKFRSAALDTDETYAFTFTEPGTYPYFCSLHTTMVGTIIVTGQPGALSKP